MNDNTPDVHLAIYGPDHFPKPSPFGERGYLFTVPGSFPEDTPAHTNVTDWEMAVYLTDDGDEWKVRDVNGNRRVWGTGGSRREAIGLAFLEIARLRRIQAAEVARKREADGLEPAPPYAVECLNSVTLVCAPTAVAVLTAIEGTGDTADRYHVRDIDGGQPYTIRADDSVVLRTTSTGVLHNRCGCQPEDAARFEQETQALLYAANAMTFCWPCDQVPKG